MNINFKPDYILSIHNINLTNTFVTSVLVTFILGILSILFYIRRSGFFANIAKVVIFDLLRFIDMITHNRDLSKKVFPVVATFFLFIISANFLALVPGFLGSFFIKAGQNNYHIPLLRSPNSDLTITLALALFSVASIQFFSMRILGIKKYIKRFVNFANPIRFILGLFELMSEAVKVLSFSFRLFGNIFAGEVLLLIIAFLAPYIIPVPFMLLEVFVGIIQAFIFSVLTLAFIQTSVMRYE